MLTRLIIEILNFMNKLLYIGKKILLRKQSGEIGKNVNF